MLKTLHTWSGGVLRSEEPKPESEKLIECWKRFLSGVSSTLDLEGQFTVHLEGENSCESTSITVAPMSKRRTTTDR